MAADVWESAWSDVWQDEPGGALHGTALTVKAADEDPEIEAAIRAHQEWTDTAVADFEKRVKAIVEAAAKSTLTYLKAQLAVTDGLIDATAANDTVLTGADAVFMRFMEAEGYGKLLKEFTGKFSDQLPYLQDMLDAIAKSLGRDLPSVEFSAGDLKVLGRIEANTIGKLERLFSGAASVAFDRVMFSVAALPFKQLVATIADQMGKTTAAATTWADTAVSTWYRTASSLTFDSIQKETPGALKFRYSGPADLKTREFCAALLAADGRYTRDEINQMDNGQLPNVFVSCGGYNCRHIWVLAKA